jgi:hypothetical protein
VALICVLVGGAFIYFGLLLPRVAPPGTLSVQPTPERLARGKYIFEVVSDCGGCHSIRDFSRFGGPELPNTRGKGQVLAMNDLPGRIVAPNITPDPETGIGKWTDGEKIRAVREGIDKDGRTLFPMMPYSEYRAMSDSDAESLVAYLDSLPPIRNSLPATKVDFPVSIFIRSAPQPTGSVTAPPRTNTVAYGGYLVAIAGCKTCHTQADKGQLKEELSFAGGRLFAMPFGKVLSSNISPDPDTGIGAWSLDYFKQRFIAQQAHLQPGGPKVGPEQFTVMPWLGLSQMDEQDLAAVYAFLQKQPSIRNKVQTHPAMQKAQM